MRNHHGDRLGITRRRMLGAGAAFAPSLASAAVTLPFAGGATERQLTTAFPEKGSMILQRSRPPLLETPFSVFDGNILTPNNQFYVRWHWAVIPTDIKVDTFRLKVHGHVDKEISLSLAELMAMPRVEVVAVNQCSGNSRGYFAPRVAGGQWSNGAMGNARWTGVRLKDVLDRAGVKAGAVQVRFDGMDTPVVPDAPDLMKSLAIDHARDGEVILAYGMNGAQLPLLNGFPLRAVVPGWYGTYWVKMLNDLEVLTSPDENFWMKVAYTIPDTPHADMKPGEAGVKMVPINKMVPRSFITNLTDGAAVRRLMVAPASVRDRLPAGPPVRTQSLGIPYFTSHRPSTGSRVWRIPTCVSSTAPPATGGCCCRAQSTGTRSTWTWPAVCAMPSGRRRPARWC